MTMTRLDLSDDSQKSRETFLKAFDVDPKTGFVPSDPPLGRLPPRWEAWEDILDEARKGRLQLGDKPDIEASEVKKSAVWRSSVCNLPVLSITEMDQSMAILRRAHVVLTWLLHFYVQSLPPDHPVSIPASISLPLLRLGALLQIPPVLTYADTAGYNWGLKTPSDASPPALDNLRSHTLFTGTDDEDIFFLTSVRIEIRGAEALEMLRLVLIDIADGSAASIKRVVSSLHKIISVIHDLKKILLSIREGCDPDVFYNEIRPWLRGIDDRKWTFEGLEQDPSLTYPTELAGTTAGQSSLLRSLDLLLGVDQSPHSSSSSGSDKQVFMNRMRLYMPRGHREFLEHLSSTPTSLRSVVESSGNVELREAYNATVSALKEFRDSHIVIVTLYVMQPAKRAAKLAAGASSEKGGDDPVKGTGGMNAVKFLKEIRDGTTKAVMPTP